MGKLEFWASISVGVVLMALPLVFPSIPFWLSAPIFALGLAGFAACVVIAIWRRVVGKSLTVKGMRMTQSRPGSTFAELSRIDGLDMTDNYSDADTFLRIGEGRDVHVANNTHSPNSPSRGRRIDAPKSEQSSPPEVEPKEKRRTYFAGWRPEPAEDKED